MNLTSDEGFDPKAFLQTLTRRPGVYRMFDAEGKVIYVGKAKDLKRRVSSYFSRSLNGRTRLMVSKIRDIQVTVTHTESEALILENTLIKSLLPRYNVLLRDDKSYPYIFLSSGPFPRLTFHRGAKREKGRYFGPYPNMGSTRETLQLLQKLFPIRQCEESFFRNRSRPCLQYQIQRCTAPCVGLVSEEAYARDLGDAVRFLEGKAGEVIERLGARMEAAAEQLEFEQAAHFRDQIVRLRGIQERQYVSGERGDLDLVACEVTEESACVQLFFVRGGRNLGNKVFFPRVPPGEEAGRIVSAFLGQYYLGRTIPKEILVHPPPHHRELLEEAFSSEAGHPVKLTSRVRGDRTRWIANARENARIALRSRLAGQASLLKRYEALQEALALEALPERLECFDISHSMGEATVASCVVFNLEGPLKSDYRRFNIRDVEAGDDYAAMEQALTRRYARIQSGEGVLPDILFVDGGKGQLSVATRVLNELAVAGVTLVGIAKGEGRKAGLEKLLVEGREGPPIHLPADAPALHLIQQIRDEAHRFAITGHRRQRDQARKRSSLEEVPGIGAARRRRLLTHLGGLQGVARAGVEELCQVEGISRRLAERIYHTFHGNE